MVLRLQHKEERENERLLRGLEQRYDKSVEHWRRFAEDKATLKKLVLRGAIDKEHADILFKAACDKFWSMEWVRVTRKREAQGRIRAGRQGGYIALGMLVIAVIWWFVFGHWASKIGF